MVYLTHRSWINRIRPQFRRVRAQRAEINSLTTESFGGMRVVRGFSRQHAETNCIMRGNHVMASILGQAKLAQCLGSKLIKRLAMFCYAFSLVLISFGQPL